MKNHSKIEFIPLASGSDGNAYILKGVETSLLLECGIDFKRLRTPLKKYREELKGVLITHEHFDHCKSANDFSYYGYELYASEGTFDSINLKYNHRNNVVKANDEFKIGEEWTILPFETNHDAEEPLGFFIKNNITKEKLVFITDTYYVEYKFPGATHWVVECNYDSEYLKEHLDEIAYSRRLLKSHLSLQNCVRLLEANDLSMTKEIWLVHLSSRNSNAIEFEKIVTEATGKVVKVA